MKYAQLAINNVVICSLLRRYRCIEPAPLRRLAHRRSPQKSDP
jgi:hypothetical protein